ncbi:MULTISPECIES: hypothetical protein [Burkholderia cepacia complex]|uniref:hypothetical protein n=1 Tax=Burkholderia cepacia complex TaxID=87882 RepID=UPI000AD24FC3|nr:MULTISPECIES: hypothetical protein [Burkholderia cepacia complex]
MRSRSGAVRKINGSIGRWLDMAASRIAEERITTAREATSLRRPAISIDVCRYESTPGASLNAEGPPVMAHRFPYVTPSNPEN